jgi:hypothetical protein
MDNELINAYLTTDYIIDDTLGMWMINIDQMDKPLSSYLHKFKQPTAAFITAFNPMSKRCKENQNKQQQAKLVKQLQQNSVTFLTGFAIDQDGAWPQEDSVLIVNINKQQASKIAKQFNQAAYVWIDETGMPLLVTHQEY